MIPGQNILDMAFTLIATKPIDYYKFLRRETTEAGDDVTIYADPVSINASVQIVQRSQYQNLGLYFNSRYIKIYASVDLEDLTRDRSGDQVVWNSRRYELMNASEWTPIDGWNGILGIEVSTL